jgi:hypothetical protein
MWPEAVERVAIFLRASGVEGRLEQLLEGADRPPGVLLAVAAFVCGPGRLVTLLPAGRTLDESKVARAGGCDSVRRVASPEFPFQGSKVLLDLAAMSASTLWLELGSGRHLLGLAPSQLARLSEAQTVDLVAES